MEGNNNLQAAVNKGTWTPAEDERLRSFIEQHGHGNWRALPRAAGLNRCGKSCRLRWVNYLRPDIKRGNFTPEEYRTIVNLHNELGSKWAKIASKLPGRTDNEIKNVCHSRLKNVANKLAARKNGGKDSKMEGSVSTSYASSSITGTERNMEKALGDREFQELEIKKPGEELFSANDYFSIPIDEMIMHDILQLQNQDLADDLPVSGVMMNQEACPDGEGNIEILMGSDGVMNQEQYCPYDDGEFAIPVEPDVDFWELMMDSLDLEPLQEQNGGIQGLEEQDGEVPAQVEDAEVQDINPTNEAKKLNDDPEYKEWRKYMENFELEAASDDGNLPNRGEEKVEMEPKSTIDDDLEWYKNMPGSPGDPFGQFW